MLTESRDMAMADRSLQIERTMRAHDGHSRLRKMMPKKKKPRMSRELATLQPVQSNCKENCTSWP